MKHPYEPCTTAACPERALNITHEQVDGATVARAWCDEHDPKERAAIAAAEWAERNPDEPV